MNIWVNDKPHEVPEPTALAVLLRKLDVSTRKGIAVAVNDDLLPRGQWKDYQIKPNDRILLITASQGG